MYLIMYIYIIFLYENYIELINIYNLAENYFTLYLMYKKYVKNLLTHYFNININELGFRQRVA